MLDPGSSRKTQLWFRSDLFEITPGEDADTNPLCFGRALAEWLAERLAFLGYEVEPVIAEDWGWCVMCARQPFPLWVGCVSSIHDYAKTRPDDPTPRGKDVTWSCIVCAEPSLLTRLLKRPDTRPRMDELIGRVQVLLRDDAKVTFVGEDGKPLAAGESDATV